jgi:hypothetical protein
MIQHIEAKCSELDPTFEQVLATEVFVGDRPSFIDEPHGKFDRQKVAVLRVDQRYLPYDMYVCLPRLARVSENVRVEHDGSVDGIVRLAVPFAVQGQLRYFNALFERERLKRTGMSPEQFEADEHSIPWIGYPQRRIAAPAPGLYDGGKLLTFVLTPHIRQCFASGHRRNAVWQATEVAILDRNPLVVS